MGIERPLVVRQNKGLTLIELIVVLTIIGVLMALLLPAVQATRSASRNNSCKNNLKQLGLGLHQFESAHRHLPCSSIDPDWISASGEWSWGSRVLRYIEQTALHERCDFNLWPAEMPNNEVIATPVPTFRCPSEIVPRHQIAEVWDGYSKILIELPNDNYGINEPLDQLYANGSECWRFADIKDGLSNTIMLGETTAFMFPDDTTSQLHWHITWSCSISAGGGTPVERDFWSTVDCTGITTPAEQEWDYLSSYHQGGSNVARCDGSVRFISESIDEETLQRLADPSDGQLVGDY